MEEPGGGCDIIGLTKKMKKVGSDYVKDKEIVKRFGSGKITVQEIKGDKIKVTTATGDIKIIPLSKWYTFRFAPTN